MSEKYGVSIVSGMNAIAPALKFRQKIFRSGKSGLDFDKYDESCHHFLLYDLGCVALVFQSKFGGSSIYDRIDVRLTNVDIRESIEKSLEESLGSHFLGLPIKEVIRKDGVKIRFGTWHWLMFRFSGTEPLLRLYCEAKNKEELSTTLLLAKEFIDSK